jgi:hypothetical protein
MAARTMVTPFAIVNAFGSAAVWFSPDIRGMSRTPARFCC